MSKDKQSIVEIARDHVEVASNNSEFKTDFKFAADTRKFQVIAPMRHGEFPSSWISKEWESFRELWKIAFIIVSLVEKLRQR